MISSLISAVFYSLMLFHTFPTDLHSNSRWELTCHPRCPHEETQGLARSQKWQNHLCSRYLSHIRSEGHTEPTSSMGIGMGWLAGILTVLCDEHLLRARLAHGGADRGTQAQAAVHLSYIYSRHRGHNTSTSAWRCSAFPSNSALRFTARLTLHPTCAPCAAGQWWPWAGAGLEAAARDA